MLDVEYLQQFYSYDSDRGELVWKIPQLAGAKNPGDPVSFTVLRKESGAKYAIITIQGHHLFFHRLVWAICTGGWPSGQIDHIDRNSMNNRMDNLRIVTGSENCHNSMKTGRDLPHGVSRRKSGKYRAGLTINGVRVFEREYRTPGQAATAYIEAKRKYCPGITEDWYIKYRELWGHWINPLRVALP
jgi:hypothetical protein